MTTCQSTQSQTSQDKNQIYIYVYHRIYIYTYILSTPSWIRKLGGQNTSLEKNSKIANHNLQKPSTTKRIHLFSYSSGEVLPPLSPRPPPISLWWRGFPHKDNAAFNIASTSFLGTSASSVNKGCFNWREGKKPQDSKPKVFFRTKAGHSEHPKWWPQEHRSEWCCGKLGNPSSASISNLRCLCKTTIAWVKVFSPQH